MERKQLNNNEDLMIITNNGIIIRLDVNAISQMGRVTQGVKLINLKDDNKVASISLVEKEEVEEESELKDEVTTDNNMNKETDEQENN